MKMHRTTEAGGDRTSKASLSGPLTTMLLLAFAVGLLNRLLVGWGAPLWYDETWTATIAAQERFSSLIAWCLEDPNGPVYYVLAWCWEKIAGPGDTALRLPSLLFSLAAPALLLWKGHPDRDVRQLWAALAAVWAPGLLFANEARSYTLLFFLGSVQAIAFLRMMRAPGTGPALAWSAVSTLAVLTHYHALPITALQGLAYLATGGRAAWRSWPGALPFLAAAAWMSVHLPVILPFADPQYAWYQQLGPQALMSIPFVLLGIGLPAGCLLVAVAATWAWQGWRARTGRAAFPYSTAEALLVASGVLAFAVVFGIGFLRPSFTPRYVLPDIPAILLGLALWARRLERGWPRSGILLLALASALGIAVMIVRLADPRSDHRYGYNFEEPSAWLRSRGIERLVFLLDGPSAAVIKTGSLRQLGGFFLWRGGHPVPVTALRLSQNVDPNRALLGAARPKGTGILWAYDTNVPRTRGVRYPARIAAIDPRWSCRDFGEGSIHVVACIAD